MKPRSLVAATAEVGPRSILEGATVWRPPRTKSAGAARSRRATALVSLGRSLALGCARRLRDGGLAIRPAHSEGRHRSVVSNEVGECLALHAWRDADLLPHVTARGSRQRDARRQGFGGVVLRLAATNGLGLVAGLIASPITARALGAEGRGELAAILSVLLIVPWVLDFGLSQWLARERAQGRHRRDLLGAALPLALACSLVGVALAIPASRAIGGDRPTVVTFIEIGLLAAPLTVLLQTLVGLAMGESRWGVFNLSRAITAALPTAAIIVLALLHELTVTTAAIAYLTGSLLGTMLFLRLVPGTGRLTFDLRTTRAAAKFGANSWLTVVGSVANYRLDQVLMAVLVPSRELGLYVVAVACTAVTTGVMSAVTSAVFPRVAQGDIHLAARACRVTILAVSFLAAGVAVAIPTIIPFAFGSEFRDSVGMATLLLAASVPLAAASVLAAGLSAAGDPAATMRAELLALAVTVPALVLLLPAFGGEGAAAVSLFAYTLKLIAQLRAASRRFSLSWWAFLRPTRTDMRWLHTKLATAFSARPAPTNDT